MSSMSELRSEALDELITNMETIRQALKVCLEERGVLQDVRAKVRSGIFSCLDENDPSRPQPSSRNALINELIAEYLDYNGYRCASPPCASHSCLM